MSQQATIENGKYLFIHLATGRALDGDAARAGSVYTLPLEKGNVYQVWEITAVEPGIYTVKHCHDDRFLDSNEAEKVYLLGSNGGKYQQWRIGKVAFGRYRSQNVGTQLLLDSRVGDDGGLVYTHAFVENNLHQEWILVAAP